MKVYSAQETARLTPFPALLEQLRLVFGEGMRAPMRHHHTMHRQDEEDATLLLMPAWTTGDRRGGVKIVNVHPGNRVRGMAAISASYLVFDEKTGEHLALLDGNVLTARRTAAASALAASLLARPDARCLLIAGAGAVARQLAGAYASAFSLDQVLVWNRSPENAEALVEEISSIGLKAKKIDDLKNGVVRADIITCATLAVEPLIKGAWLRDGQHVDLIGSFTPKMRETDDEAVRRARIFIDTEAAKTESGDIVIPLASRVLAEDDIQGTLYDLCAGKIGRKSASEITLFKNVGNAIEDLAAAIVALDNTGG